MLNHAAPSRRSLPKWLSWSILIVSAAWLMLTGSLWLATGQRLPMINVRWAPSVTIDQRVQAEQELSLILREPAAGRTGIYYLARADEATIRRIVGHPLIEDTAHISRGTLQLENAPYGHMWIGDRWTVLKQPVLLFAAIIGGLTAAALLVLPASPR